MLDSRARKLLGVRLTRPNQISGEAGADGKRKREKNTSDHHFK